LLGNNDFPAFPGDRELDDKKQEHCLLNCTFGGKKQTKSFKKVYLVHLLLHRFSSQVLCVQAKNYLESFPGFDFTSLIFF